MLRWVLIVFCLICGTSGVSVFSAPATFRMPLQSIGQVSTMQRDIDRLVAVGYRLLASKRGEGLPYREFVLIKNANSPVYRYTETKVGQVDGRYAGRYGVLSTGHFALDNEIIVDAELQQYVPAKKERYGIPPAFPKGHPSASAVPDDNKTHVHAYELIPRATEGTYILINASNFNEMHPVDDYHIFRNEHVDAQQRKITDTLTINGWNPYIVYRHTHVAAANGMVVAEVLSAGRYPAPAVNDYAVEIFAAEIQGLAGEHYGNYKFYRGNNPHLDDIPLTVISSPSLWNVYQDPLGAGVDEWVGRIWFNGYRKDGLVLHEVSSSAIDRIGYAERTGELWVLFNEHGEYHSYLYLGVPAQVFNDFLNAESKGKYYNAHVKGKYPRLKY